MKASIIGTSQQGRLKNISEFERFIESD